LRIILSYKTLTMHHLRFSPKLAIAAVCAAALLPAWADSTSSASSASSASVGSSSDSIQNSSESSSNSSGDKKEVAKGTYTLVDIVPDAHKPGVMRLRLQGQTLAQSAEFFLLVPQKVVQQARLVPGLTLLAEQRAYGMAFSAEGASPFFLVVQDAVYREMESRPLAI
jgi:hypothetical protein